MAATPADVKLWMYNEALRLVGERQLASLTENREPRRLLDAVWDSNARDYCLELGQWQFATRTVSLTYSPSVEPAFGYTYAFQRPDDFIRTVAVSGDDRFINPLLRYSTTGGMWFADLDTIFVQYVSNDAQYGADLSVWTNKFQKMVSAYLAREIAPRLTQLSEAKLQALERLYEDRLSDAQSTDAMERPTTFPPMGSWVAARGYGRNSYRRNG